MSGFSAADITTLDFDFTGILQQDGSGPCTGKGVMAEPNEDAMRAFFDGINAVHSIERELLDPASKLTEDEVKAQAETIVDDIRAIISAVGSGTPSEDELAQLPPRAIRAFFKWLMQELTDPKG